MGHSVCCRPSGVGARTEFGSIAPNGRLSMMTYSHHETAVDTFSGHTPSGDTLFMPALLWPLLSPAAPVVCVLPAV